MERREAHAEAEGGALSRRDLLRGRWFGALRGPSASARPSTSSTSATPGPGSPPSATRDARAPASSSPRRPEAASLVSAVVSSVLGPVGRMAEAIADLEGPATLDRPSAPVRRLDLDGAPAPRGAFGRGRVLPVHRPPGALPEAEFLAGCTRCMDCARACPHEAIVTAPARLQAAAGTPVIDAASAPCLLCADMPCVTACAPGVLRSDRPQRMGSARVVERACLGALGLGCTVCVERCPVPGVMRLERGRPVIEAAACVGCGVCLHVCPAPEKAILLLPLPDRPPTLASAACTPELEERGS